MFNTVITAGTCVPLDRRVLYQQPSQPLPPIGVYVCVATPTFAVRVSVFLSGASNCEIVRAQEKRQVTACFPPNAALHKPHVMFVFALTASVGHDGDGVCCGGGGEEQALDPASVRRRRQSDQEFAPRR